jgi:hypothetical protein
MEGHSITGVQHLHHFSLPIRVISQLCLRVIGTNYVKSERRCWPSASSRDRVDGVIDESLLDGDDDMDFDAENAQKETEADETVNGVLQEYMADILGRIKQQIDSRGRPDCYANGTFWERPKDPLFALQASATRATGVSPTELYHLDVFIWLPDRIQGFSGSFSLLLHPPS